eukprot:scaffold16371_cov95-Isochrysis_galbana.AAC.5
MEHREEGSSETEKQRAAKENKQERRGRSASGNGSTTRRCRESRQKVARLVPKRHSRVRLCSGGQSRRAGVRPRQAECVGARRLTRPKGVWHGRSVALRDRSLGGGRPAAVLASEGTLDAASARVESSERPNSGACR